MAYDAKIIADSVSEAGHRLTTMEVTLPRIVLAEFNTHRMFSRNSASSRAIPFDKQLKRIQEDPFIPSYWGANQKGMQASAEISDIGKQAARSLWLEARDKAISRAQDLHKLGVHKQTVNRLLEPFMWQTILVSATEWSNFYALRANPDAQPEIRIAAEMMRDVHEASTPKLLRTGEWHLPLIQEDELEWAAHNTEKAIQVCVGRCARVSYLTHDGRRDLNDDLTLYGRLVTGGHMSPAEHVARPISKIELIMKPSSHWSGNFHGWQQFRKTLPNENDFSKVTQGE